MKTKYFAFLILLTVTFISCSEDIAKIPYTALEDLSSSNEENSSSSYSENSSSSEEISSSSVSLCADFVEGTTTSHYEKDKQQFCDERDGKKYVYVKIGEQTWMAENLNYWTKDSFCYNNDENNCEKYGRLYNWNKTDTICPKDFHLPTENEWRTLITTINTEQECEGTCTSKYLKATSWQNSEDTYGFTALPGGLKKSSADDFSDLGKYGYWWSATEGSETKTTARRLILQDDNAFSFMNSSKNYSFSVRCLQDIEP